MGLFIAVYALAILLIGLTAGWAAALARRGGHRLSRAFLYLVVVNDAIVLSEILLHLFPSWTRSGPAAAAALLSGFIAFPLLAAFTVVVVEFQLALVDVRFPSALRIGFGVFWGGLFLGFLAAEYRQFALSDLRLTRLLQPAFNVAIVLSGLGSAAFVLWRSRRVRDAEEQRFVRRAAAYLFVAFLVFGGLFYLPLRMDPGLRVLVRSVLGLAYLLPILLWMSRRVAETRSVALTVLTGDRAALDGWLEAKELSPRERQIARCVLEGKSNAAVEKELFIGRRTVESHLYNVYRKLGVKSRLQLARLAAAEMERMGERSELRGKVPR